MLDKEKKIYDNKQWLEENLKKYKTVIKIARNTGISRHNIYRCIDKYNLRHLIEHPPQNSVHIFNNDYFENIDTEEKAYWLGLFMADGNVTDNNRKSYTVRILLKESDINHIDKFIKAIGSNKKTKIDKLNRGSITINSKKMYYDLCSYGVTPDKTGKEIIPKIDKNLIRHFIRGFMDGDGTIYSRKPNPVRKRSRCIIGFVCACKKFTEDLTNIFLEVSNSTTAKISTKMCKNMPVYEWKTESIIACEKIIHYLYDDATIYLQRKYDIAMNFLKICPTLKPRKCRN